MRPYHAISIVTAPSEQGLDAPCPEDFLHKGIRSDFKPETRERYMLDNERAWREEVGIYSAKDWRRGEIATIGLAIPRGGGAEDTFELHVWLNGHFDANSTDPLEDELHGGNIGYTLHCCAGESRMLEAFWTAMESAGRGMTAGFGFRDFTMPWLLFRSGTNFVKPTRDWEMSRYNNHGNVVDWSDVLSAYGRFPIAGWTLQYYAEWFELPFRPVSDGSEVAEQYAAGELYEVCRHQAFHTLAVAALHARFAPAYYPENLINHRRGL